MTFEWSAEHVALAGRARDVARTVVAPQAASIDGAGVVPAAVLTAIGAASLGDPLSHGAEGALAILEELGAVSAGVATVVGLTSVVPAASSPSAAPWAGLRGGAAVLTAVALADAAANGRGHLVLAAVALGVGGAAVAEAVASMTARGLRPSGDETTPHWLLADAATEVESARLLMRQAAQTIDRGEPAIDAVRLAGRYAAAAAARAVDAAMAIAGPDSHRQGATLERLSRDARTLSLILNA